MRSTRKRGDCMCGNGGIKGNNKKREKEEVEFEKVEV